METARKQTTTGGVLKIFILISVALINSCSPNRQTAFDDFDDFEIDNDKSLFFDETTMHGYGFIHFRQAFSSPFVSRHYVLEGEFLFDQSELILHSHFTSRSRRNGIELHMQRKGHDLHLLISAPGTLPIPLGALDDLFHQSRRFSLRIEIHNHGPKGVRVWVWNDRQPQAQSRFQRLRNISLNTVALTNKGFEYLLPSGRGSSWGLELINVRLFKAQAHPAYLESLR